MMLEALRPLRQGGRLALLGAGLITAVGLTTLVGLSQRPAEAAPQQQAKTYYIPDAQTRGFGLTGLDLDDLRPQGMFGFGYSSIEMVNRTAAAVDAQISLNNFDNPKRLSRSVGPRRVTSLSLRRESAFGLGDYHGHITAGDELGVTVRTEWPEGGSAFSYMAPEQGTSLILPLAARGVYSFSSNVHIQNANDSDETNNVEMVFFNPQGSIQKSLGLRLEGDASTEYDLLFDAQFGDLPVNSADGYLNAIHFTSDEAIAVMVLGDELGGVGTSALRARPAGLARTVQHLPLVRSNYLGDSLIGIANRENEAVDVTVNYRGADDSPSGAGKSFAQQLRIEARSAAFVDLSSRGRGNAGASGLPRGSGVNRGFYGSASVEASGRVLAATVEQAFDGTTAQTNAGYNAFGPIDLATAWAVPLSGHRTEGRRQYMVVYNPGVDPVGLSFALLRSDGGRAAERSENLAAGSMAMIPVQVPADMPAEQALIESTGPVAVIDYETRLSGTSDWGSWGVDTLAGWAVPVPGGGGEAPPTNTPTDIPPSPTATATATETPGPGVTPSSPTPTGSPTGGPEDVLIYLPMCPRNT